MQPIEGQGVAGRKSGKACLHSGASYRRQDVTVNDAKAVSRIAVKRT